MSNNPTNTLISQLEQEVAWVKELIVVLAEEKKVLEANQFEKLDTISEQKQTLSNQLEESTRQRLALLKANPNNPSEYKASLDAFLGQLSPNEAARIGELNESLTEQLQICRQGNIVNGQVIATNLMVKQANVDDLTKHPTTEQGSVTYDAKGGMKKSSGSGSSQQV